MDHKFVCGGHLTWEAWLLIGIVRVVGYNTYRSKELQFDMCSKIAQASIDEGSEWANMTSTEKALMIMSTRSTIWRSSFGSVDQGRFLCHHYDENDPELTLESNDKTARI